MTPKETVDELERDCDCAVDEQHGRGRVIVDAQRIKDLLADSRAIRELLDALPRCCSNKCDEIATYAEPTFGGDFADTFHCDDHALLDGAHPDKELAYATIVRKVMK